MKNEKKDIAIVVLSFDGFKELWEPFFDFFFKSWPNCPYTVYLLNNHKKYNFYSVKNLLVGPDFSWSSSLIKGLKKIKEKRVFFLYDDCFIKNIDLEILNNFFDLSIKNDLVSLQLRPSYFISKFGFNKPVLIPKFALYRNALFCNLIERKHLIKLLRFDESAWDFELLGNKRSCDYNYYSVRRPCIDYDHGIVKGKWLPKTYKKLVNCSYKFKKLNKVMSTSESFKLKLKTFFHNFYMYITPLKLLLFLENKRKGDIYK